MSFGQRISGFIGGGGGAGGTVTSVGLTMPLAFNVTNSPVTNSGTIDVTGAGLATQYIRGDGQLANFPSSSGTGSIVTYYLNGSVNQGTFGGDTYYQFSQTPILGAGTNFIRTQVQGNGYIASFISDVGDPNLLNIPAGNWGLEFYFSASANGDTPRFYGELYKVSASNVFTLIATESANPEFITNGTSIDQYFTSIAVPQTALLATDRLAIRVYVIPTARDITLHTEGTTLSEVITTFSTGLTALNGLTEQVQFLAVGTSGTDFAISSTLATHTFNLPTASAVNRGALSSADWTTFNDKLTLPSLTLGSVLFSNGTTIAQDNANFFWDDTNNRLGIGTTTPSSTLQVNGAATATSLVVNTSGQSSTITTFYGAGSDGNNIFIGGGGLGSGTGGGSNLLGSYNTSLGGNALLNNTTGSTNTAVGYQSLLSNSSGIENTAVGYQSLSTNTIGSFNTALGLQSLRDNSIGSRNAAFGEQSLLSNLSGSNNTALGYRAGYGLGTNFNLTGNNNIFIGYESVGVSAVESNRTWIGNGSTITTVVRGNLLLGTTTDAGFQLDVNGTARIQTNLKVGAATAQNASAVLDVESTTKGVLIPRMTTVQRNAIVTPATGLQIYNTTTNTNDYWNGTTWVSLSVGAFVPLSGTINAAPITGRLRTTNDIGVWSQFGGDFITRRLITGVVYGGDGVPQNIDDAGVIQAVLDVKYDGTIGYSKLKAVSNDFDGTSRTAEIYAQANAYDGTSNVVVNALQGLLVNGQITSSNKITITSGGLRIGTDATESDRLIVVNPTNPTTGTTQYLEVIAPTYTGNITNLYGRLQYGVCNSGTINNAYMLYLGLWSGTATFGNKWGIYQEGTSEKNFFGGTTLIGTTTDAPSSILTLNSVTKGFLQPRMTTVQRDAIISPATGLQIYNTTTNTNQYYNGTTWISLQNLVTLTTTGTSGAATFNQSTGALNIPNYASGVSSLSAIGASANANGATISGSVLNLQPASASFGGVVTTGTQTFAGAKTFSSDTIISTITVGRGLNSLVQNTAVGFNALSSVSTGNFNTCVGYQAGRLISLGTDNVAFGYNALQANQLGVGNVAIGTNALLTQNSNAGQYNTAVGLTCLAFQTTANANVGVGTEVFVNNITGSNNVGVGYRAGRWFSTSNTNLTNISTSILIGNFTRAGGDFQNNQIVIGDSAVGLGSGTTILGNDSTITTAIRGNLILGTQTDSGFRLDVNGTARIQTKLSVGTSGTNAAALLEVTSTTQGVLFPRMTTVQKNAIVSPVAGLVIYDSTLNKLCVYTTAWQTITST